MKHHLPEHLRDPNREARNEHKFGPGKPVPQGPYQKTWTGTLMVLFVVLLVALVYGMV